MGAVNDLELMQARADVLFTYDERDRIVHHNDPEMRPAPLVFLAYTPGGYVIRYGQAVPNGVANRLREIVDRQPPIEDLRSVLPVVTAIQDVLGQPPSNQEGGPAYRFPDALPAIANAVQVTEANVEVAGDTFPWLLTELAGWRPCFAVVRDNAAVSVCFSARIGEVVCEAGVETLPAFRRHGYASAATAAWAAAIRDSGRIPLYSTSWRNLASQRVARHLELIMFGADAIWP
jgi:RimJ/RimL family protein N-acetyltransferase